MSRRPVLPLLALQARRDWWQLVIWTVVVGALVAGTGSAVLAEFPTEQDRVGLVQLALANPALLAVRGVPNGAGAGSVIFFQVFSWLAVVVALVNTFLATRHGRADEENGRRELLASAPVRRTAPVVATLTLGVLLDVALAAAAAGALAAIGLGLRGALIAGAALGATGFAFLGLSLLVGQLAPTSRAANGIAGAAVGLAYLLRATGDALGTPDLPALTLRAAWPSWASPIGWGEQTFALTANRAWPLLLSLAFGALGAGLALLVQSRRDLARSVLPRRRGRATSSAGLRSNFGLAWRLHRPALAGWVVGGAILGVLTGALSRAATDATLANPQVQQVLASLAPGGAGDLVSLLVTAVVGLAGVLAAAAGMQGVLRMRADEVDGGAELVLSARVSRAVWLFDAVAVGTISVLAVIFSVAAAAWLTFTLTGDAAHGLFAARQSLAGLPAALVFVSLAALLVAAWPRASIGLGWALFGLAVLVGQFGGLLRLPAPVREASPFRHIPAVPIVDWLPQIVMLALTVVLTGVATLALRRRDLAG